MDMTGWRIVICVVIVVISVTAAVLAIERFENAVDPRNLCRVRDSANKIFEFDENLMVPIRSDPDKEANHCYVPHPMSGSECSRGYAVPSTNMGNAVVESIESNKVIKGLPRCYMKIRNGLDRDSYTMLQKDMHLMYLLRNKTYADMVRRVKEMTEEYNRLRVVLVERQNTERQLMGDMGAWDSARKCQENNNNIGRLIENKRMDACRASSGSATVPTIYEHPDYQGWAVPLTEGSFNLGMLMQRGFTNDKASSIRVPSGWKVTLFQHDGFTGLSKTVTGNTRYLGEIGMDDSVSSVQVVRTTPPPAPPQPPSSSAAASGVKFPTFYEHCDYTGWAVALNAGRYNQQTLGSMGFRNDNASSVRVPPGWTVTVYEHGDFTGRSLTLRADDNCLVSRGMNDAVSSVVVVNSNAVSSGSINRPSYPVLYEHCDYKGIATLLSKTGSYTLRELKRLGYVNDTASSIRVPPGWKVTLFEHDNFQGRNVSVKGDYRCFDSTMAFGNRVSSVKVSKSTRSFSGRAKTSSAQRTTPAPSTQTAIRVQLAPASGSFTQSCRNCGGNVNSGTGYMKCQCMNVKRVWVDTTITNLASCPRNGTSPQVMNSDGRLQCVGPSPTPARRASTPTGTPAMRSTSSEAARIAAALSTSSALAKFGVTSVKVI